MDRSKRTERRETFDTVAELYQRARPGHPPELFEDLFAIAGLSAGDEALEIGCGAGQASVPLAERGLKLTCIELGKNLAAIAQRRIDPFLGKVLVSDFEKWEAAGREFDLVFSARSWHWLDPETRYQRARDVLRAGGSLAVVTGEHAFPPDYDKFFDLIQPVYDRIGEGRGDWPPHRPEQAEDLRTEMMATELFSSVEVRRYVSSRFYTAEQYVDLLGTYSNHIAMEATRREELYSEVLRLVRSRPGGRIRHDHLEILNVARAGSAG